MTTFLIILGLLIWTGISVFVFFNDWIHYGKNEDAPRPWIVNAFLYMPSLAIACVIGAITLIKDWFKKKDV